MKITYDILTNNDAARLAHAITQKLSEGWELVGGVSLSVTDTDNSYYSTYAQAIIFKTP